MFKCNNEMHRRLSKTTEATASMNSKISITRSQALKYENKTKMKKIKKTHNREVNCIKPVKCNDIQYVSKTYILYRTAKTFKNKKKKKLHPSLFIRNCETITYESSALF